MELRPVRLFHLEAGKKNDRINLRMSQNQWDDIKDYCEENDIKQSYFIRHTIIAKLTGSAPYDFKKSAYHYDDQELINPKSIAINNDLKINIVKILSDKTEFDLNSYTRLALTEKLKYYNFKLR